MLTRMHTSTHARTCPIRRLTRTELMEPSMRQHSRPLSPDPAAAVALRVTVTGGSRSSGLSLISTSGLLWRSTCCRRVSQAKPCRSIA